MRFESFAPATTPAGGAIRALISSEAAQALSRLRPFDFAVEDALDKAYGKGQWFMYWDEDLRGRPIRGTISLAFGRETLVIG
ncbi:hypothetical protein [Devosia sp.]|uniref:hypothetical protein n=1 Tax=Devosia sp. TaxID=1871048 RepID=UPI0035B45C7A